MTESVQLVLGIGLLFIFSLVKLTDCKIDFWAIIPRKNYRWVVALVWPTSCKQTTYFQKICKPVCNNDHTKLIKCPYAYIFNVSFQTRHKHTSFACLFSNSAIIHISTKSKCYIITMVGS